MAESKRLFDIQLDILNKELDHIERAIRQHDEITKSIKNWTVVAWTASIGLVLKDDKFRSFVWMTSVVPLLFWIVDGSFRRIQRRFICRVEEISDFVNSDAFKRAAESGYPMEFRLLVMRPKPRGDRDREFQNTMLGAMFFRSVWLLYAGLGLASVAIWLIVK